MEVGNTVNRLEDVPNPRATVLEVDGENILISYEEGGQGWWPPEYLEVVS